MPAAAQPTGFGPEVLQAFNIPTSAPSPIQKAPNPQLSFPVFTPPAASSYGTTNPMTVPWTPPDLAGAINAGIKTGAGLATDAITNKKSLNEIAAEEQAQKIAIARASAPGAGYYTSVGMGPAGAEVKVLSPAEIEVQRAEMATRQAAAEEARARTAQTYGQTPEAQAKIEEQRAQIEKLKTETGDEFSRRTGVTSTSGSAGENVNTGQTGGGNDWWKAF
jgi:hypothetical protein